MRGCRQGSRVPDVQAVLLSHTWGAAGSSTRFMVQVRKGNAPPGLQLQQEETGSREN